MFDLDSLTASSKQIQSDNECLKLWEIYNNSPNVHVGIDEYISFYLDFKRKFNSLSE